MKDEYLSKIPTKQIKYESEALKIVKVLDNYENRLNYLLKATLKGKEERSEEIAKSVFQSIELIIISVQRMSFGNLKIQSPGIFTSSTCMSNGSKDKFVRRSRNIWSLVKEHKPMQLNSTPDTSRLIETVLNDNNLRYRDKLKAVKQRIKCSTKKLPRYVNF